MLINEIKISWTELLKMYEIKIDRLLMHPAHKYHFLWMLSLKFTGFEFSFPCVHLKVLFNNNEEIFARPGTFSSLKKTNKPDCVFWKKKSTFTFDAYLNSFGRQLYITSCWITAIDLVFQKPSIDLCVLGKWGLTVSWIESGESPLKQSKTMQYPK